MKARRYTGTSDGVAQGRRAGMTAFIREVEKLSGGALWNNGDWVVRNQRSKNVMSVHATGRAVDLSWRKMPGKGRRNGRERALATINLLIQHANFLRIEMCLDYWPQPWGAGWRCDRQAWQTYSSRTIGGAPGGDWFHLEIAPQFADNPAEYKKRFDVLKGKM